MARIFVLAVFFATFAAAQTPTPKRLQSHQVNPDSTITFRIAAPGATKVSLSIDAFPKSLPMTRSDDGIWSVTTSALAPEFYGYTFYVDGVVQIDPLNGNIRPSLTFGSSVVEVPGATLQPWDTAAIPHGQLDHHLYTTHIAKNLPQNQNAYVVYTPPNYDSRKKGGYPVLYLLHGWSDDETGWTAVGHANDILDNLIDSGKAIPMIVVMPLGYGDFDFVTRGFSVWNDAAKVDENTTLYEQTLEDEIIPAVDREYNIAKGRDNHAIAGLSMGGLESLTVGLTHTDQFAYVAGMSSAIHGEKFNEHLPAYTAPDTARKANLKLLWVAVGTGDGLLEPNRHFVAWAKEKGFDITAVETAGAHTWLVWRDNLITLAPLLFKK